MIPVPIFFQNYSKRNLIKYIINTTKITHNSRVCIDSNIVFGQLIVNAIKGFGKENLYKDIDFSNIDDRVKERYFKPLEDGYIPNVLPTGSVLNCIELSIYALYKFNSYIDGLLWLLQFGKDSDTVGAIYGQLAGSIYGFDSLDSYYVENLMNKEFIEETFKELIENIPKEGFLEKVRSFV